MRIVPKINTTFQDYPDLESDALLLYFTGCNFFCKNCQNEILQDYNYGEEFTGYDLYRFIYNWINETSIRKEIYNKIVFVGGDPLYCNNIVGLKDFLNINKYFDVCIYTGFNIEIVKKMDLKNFKYIKCGIYDETKKQVSGKINGKFFLGSTNQEIYNNKYEKLTQDGVMQLN